MSWLVASPWFLVLVLVSYLYLLRRPRLREHRPRRTGPLVSVVIPARNDERNIEECLRSVLRTHYEPLEVIVVDDCSSDGTAEAAERVARSADDVGRVRLVRGTPLPDGWFGKQWALVQGYRAARGDLLLFTDADTRHEPELIPRVVEVVHAEAVHLVSVLPRQMMESFWERLIQPQIFLLILGRVGDIRWLNRTRVAWNAIVNGQFILTTRQAYEAAGTHESVRDTVVDDVALAQRYVRLGMDIFLIHAPEYMRTRMYHSLAEIVGGWSKNIALGTRMMTPPGRFLERLTPAVLWLPPLLWLLLWVLPPVGWVLTGARFTMLATAASFATWLIVYAAGRAPMRYAVIYPLGAVVAALIMVRSALRGRREVEWRGRVYRDIGT